MKISATKEVIVLYIQMFFCISSKEYTPSNVQAAVHASGVGGRLGGLYLHLRLCAAARRS